MLMKARSWVSGRRVPPPPATTLTVPVCLKGYGDPEE